MTVHLTSTGAYLPGPPVDNDTMEARLGQVGEKPSRYHRVVLHNNGIRNRHYAIDEAGNQTHLNEELAALAVQQAVADRGLGLGEIGMRAIGTTIPNLIMPGSASMAHDRLGLTSQTAPPRQSRTY